MSEFDKARQKFEKRKSKRIDPALPWVEHIQPETKEKPVEIRAKTKAMELVISGPIDLRLEIDWAGTLMGGQMNTQSLKTLFLKQLTPLGRVSFK